MQKRLLLLSFIEGATVMAAELCGARLLAPVFGSSLYVWASVMGITLAALAGGYFFGGFLSAGTGNLAKKLFHVLNAAALFVLLMPALGFYMVPRISYLPFIPGVISSTILILFLPVFLLGAASPLFISLQTNLPEEAGKVSGVIYGLSTVGGILATFICGFYLIPVAGLNFSLLLFGSLLFIFNLINYRSYKLPRIFLFVFLVYTIFSIHQWRSSTIFAADGILGRIEVNDHVLAGGDSFRYLTINGIIQTEMNIENGRSVSKYIRLLDSLIRPAHRGGSALVLGLGGGLSANLLASKKYRTFGVEYDSRVLAAAVSYFNLNSDVKAVNDDARHFLNSDENRYDVILFDLYKAEEQPSHVITTQSLRRIKRNLTDSGMIYINWHGYLTGRNGLGTMVLINTLEQSGFKVRVHVTDINEDERNLVFTAKLSPEQTIGFADHFVNTDDQPLLEKYNAQANRAWRANYLKYYQSN